MKAAFYTLGCKVNHYETEAIKEAFVLRGVETIDLKDIFGDDGDRMPADPKDNDQESLPDIFVINTCTVTNIADRKSRQYIRKMKAINPDAVMVVTGCYAQVAAKDVERMPEVDLVIGNNLKSEIVERSIALSKNRHISCRDDAYMYDGSIPMRGPLSHVLRYEQLNEYEDLGRVSADGSGMCRAYIKIEEGCNRFCSYCLIPYARGRVRSRAVDDIVEEARELVAGGRREIVLTGINTALYGTDIGQEKQEASRATELELLIKRLNELDGDFRIRLSSLEPTVVDINDVKRLLSYEKLCHHLHLSIQSGSDHVLGMMNRHYSVEDYLKIVKALKEFDPDYGITTDIIAGFPGETEDDHEETLDLIGRAGFGRVHVFRFSPRKGTKAAEMPDQIDGRTKARRAAELDSRAGIAAKAFIEQNMNRHHRILAEQRETISEQEYITGYTDNYIKVYIPISKDDPKDWIKTGEFYMAELTGAFADGALAKVVLAD